MELREAKTTLERSSRKQAVSLRPVRLNQVIGNVQKLLLRLLTEDIELRVDLPGFDAAAGCSLEK